MFESIKQHLWAAVVALCLYSAAPAEAQRTVPIGQALPGVSFDAKLELWAPKANTYTVIFARYWVTATQYRVEGLWAEPHWSNINSYYPVSLDIQKRESTFDVSQGLWGEHWAYKLPITSRGPFAHQNNSYPITDIRFADAEAVDCRIPARWLTGSPRHPVDTQPSPATKPDYDPGWNGKLLSHIILKDDKGRAVKKIGYKYSDVAPGVVSQTEVVLYERPILLNGLQATVTINGENALIAPDSVMQGTYHAGDRRCLVTYETVKIDSRSINLPRSIEVRNGKGLLLRRATFSNFAMLKDQKDIGKLAPVPKAVLTAEENEWCRLCAARWVVAENRNGSAKSLPDADKNRLKELIGIFEREFANSRSMFVRHKMANTLCQSYMMLDDSKQAAKWLRNYFESLHADKLDQMVVTGGKEALDLALYWDNVEMADALMSTWAQYVGSTVSEGVVLDNMASARWGDHWLAYAVLKEFEQKPTLRRDTAVLAGYLMCGHLHDLLSEEYAEAVKSNGHVRLRDALVNRWGSRAKVKEVFIKTVDKTLELAAGCEETDALKQRIAHLRQWRQHVSNPAK